MLTEFRATSGTGKLDVSQCDLDGDREPDCGMGLDGFGMANPNACAWRNAVYDLSPRQEGCRATDAGVRKPTQFDMMIFSCKSAQS
jgi:hypothetical protein